MMHGDKKLNELKTSIDDKTMEAFNRLVHTQDRTPSETLRHIVNLHLFGADSLNTCCRTEQDK